MGQRRNILLFLAGFVLVLASLACGAGTVPDSAAPAEPIEPQGTAVEGTNNGGAPPPIATNLPPTGGGQERPQPAIPESRRLTFEFPPVIRTGDSARIRLQLEVDDRGNITPTALVEGNVVAGEVVEIPNLYETHNVIAEARLDLAGMEVQPAGTISEPLTQGQPVTFYWSVRPNETGKYEGTAWLHLRFLPKGGGQESRIPLSVQFLEIEAGSFLGFISGNMARGMGAIGSVIGTVLGFPFVDDLAKWLFRRAKGVNH